MVGTILSDAPPVFKSASSNSLASKAMLVDPTIRRWTGIKHDKAVTREIALNHNSDEEMGRYSKRLLPYDAVDKAMTSFVNRVMADVRARTLPWTDNGQRILSSVGYFDFAKLMRDYNDEWNDVLMPKFAQTYPQRYADAKVMLGSLWNANDYPPAHKILSKFGFSVVYYPLPAADDFRINVGDGEIARIRQQIEDATAAAVQNSMRDVLARMQRVVGNMVERLSAYDNTGEKVAGKFHDTLVTNIEELLELLPSLNITNDPTINSFAANMVNLIRFDATDLRQDDSARKTTLETAQDILTKMEQFI